MMMWGYGPWSNGSWGGAWWMGLIGMAMHILVWVGVIALGIYFFKRISGSRSNVSQNDDALEILRQRYAKGEIDTTEFHQRRQELLK